jgi:hypothetical protein
MPDLKKKHELMLMTFPKLVARFHSKTKVKIILRLDVRIRW